MSDPRADRDAYLERVAAQLGLADEDAQDVIEELRGHLAETFAGLRDEGLTTVQAERESIARLGNPGELANAIRRARLTRRRLFAAAGAGVMAAVGSVVWGSILAWALTTVASVVAVIVMSVVLSWLHLSTPGFQPATQALLSIPIALFVPGYASHRMVRVIAARSGRPLEAIRLPVAIVGGVPLAIVTIFLVRGALDALGVLSLVAIPIGFAVGAMLVRGGGTERVRLPARRVIAAVAVLTAATLAVGAATVEINPTDGRSYIEQDLSRIARPATDVLGASSINASSNWGTGQPYQVDLSADAVDALSGWRDLRLEAWPALHDYFPVVDSAASAPAATAPMVGEDGGYWLGQLTTPVTKQRTWFVIASTGIAPDGRRYMLSGPDGPLPSQPWVGTVWEWFTTP